MKYYKWALVSCRKMISMKFFILVTDREIRGAFFFCLGIFFDMEQLSKYIQTSLTKKCFLCFVYFEFEHFAFFRWGYFRPFQQYQWQSPWQRQCWLYLELYNRRNPIWNWWYHFRYSDKLGQIPNQRTVTEVSYQRSISVTFL